MIAISHYDRESLSRFLAAQTHGPGEHDLEAMAVHLERCDQCQVALESLMEDGLTMGLAGQLLQADKNEQACGSDDQAGFAGLGQPAATERSAESVAFLEPSSQPGSLGRFARFEIMEVLGRGGMGIVLRGYDTSLNRYSAIKVLAPELASSAPARKRFFREAKSAAAVVHPHVVPIQTVDQHQGLPFLVMPVVEGQSVDARVRKSGPLETIEAVRVALQVAEGLAAAHRQGLVHRDIKPANVLLQHGVERVQITDFGLARSLDDASMTQSGVIAGTPQYMSPEQAHGDGIDHRSDLFSLGSLLYFMLAGHSPFRAETTMGVLNRVIHDRPRPLRRLNPDVPAWLESIVEKLLAKSPADRFQRADAVAEQLRDWHAHLQQPERIPAPRTRPAAITPRILSWLVGLLGAGALLIAGVLIALEVNKGTLVIDCEADDVPIRIVREGKPAQRLTVSSDGASVRIAAGEYLVEIDEPLTGLRVEEGTVVLHRGERETVKISLTADRDSRVDGEPTETAASAQILFESAGGLLVIKTSEEPISGYAPLRLNVAAGRSHEFRLIPKSSQSKTGGIFAHLDISGPTESVRPWLAANAIPVNVSREDVQQLTAGQSITKVIYLAKSSRAPVGSAVEVLVNTRLDPGVDPIAEADRRGTVLAVLRLRLKRSSHTSDRSQLLELAPDARTGDRWQLLRLTHEAHRQGIDCIRFSPDGGMLATASDDDTVKLWSVDSGKLLKTITRPVHCNSVAFSPTAALLAIAGGDSGQDPPGELVIWDLETNSPKHVLADHQNSRFHKAVAFSPNGEWVASGGVDQSVRVWEVSSGELLHEINGHEGLVSQVVFSPDSESLFSASFDATVRQWDVTSGEPIAVYEGHEGDVRDVALTPDGRHLISVSEDETARVWDAQTHLCTAEFDSHHGWILAAACCSKDDLVATAGADRHVKVWNWKTQTWPAPTPLARQAALITSLDFSPDGQFLAIASWNGFQIWRRPPAH